MTDIINRNYISILNDLLDDTNEQYTDLKNTEENEDYIYLYKNVNNPELYVAGIWKTTQKIYKFYLKPSTIFIRKCKSLSERSLKKARNNSDRTIKFVKQNSDRTINYTKNYTKNNSQKIMNGIKLNSDKIYDFLTYIINNNNNIYSQYNGLYKTQIIKTRILN